MNENDHRLTEGLDEVQHQELGDLRKLAHFLDSDVLPNPEAQQRARLLAVLTPFLPGAATTKPLGLKNWLRLARSQLVLFEKSFWLAGLFVLLLGLFIIILDGRELLPLALLLLSPVLAVAGVAYAFRPETRTLSELEMLTATGPLELLYTRLALALSFNLLTALLLLALIWLEGPQVLLWRLVLVWLGPMLVLIGLALHTTIRWGSMVGTILPLGLWGSLVLLGWREAILRKASELTPAAWLLLEISRSNPLLIGSILACLTGIGLLILAGRTVNSERQLWN